MLASALQRLQSGALASAACNDWRWDFGSTYKMASSGFGKCKEHCGRALDPVVRYKTNQGNPLAGLGQGIIAIDFQNEALNYCQAVVTTHLRLASRRVPTFGPQKQFYTWYKRPLHYRCIVEPECTRIPPKMQRLDECKLLKTGIQEG
jgi:hypothetical protein